MTCIVAPWHLLPSCRIFSIVSLISSGIVVLTIIIIALAAGKNAFGIAAKSTLPLARQATATLNGFWAWRNVSQYKDNQWTLATLWAREWHSSLCAGVVAARRRRALK